MVTLTFADWTLIVPWLRGIMGGDLVNLFGPPRRLCAKLASLGDERASKEADMLRLKTLRRTLVAAILLGTVTVVTGAEIPATMGTADVNPGVQPITACIHQGNSQLRVVGDSSLCGGDTAVSWNATVGSLLSPAVGDVFTTARPDFQSVGFGHFVLVSHLTLPPGSYVVTAKLDATASDAGDGTPTALHVHCGLVAGGDSDDTLARGLIPSPVGFILGEADMPMTLQLAHVFTESGEAQLFCSHASKSAEGTIAASFVGNLRMTAIAVGQIRVQK